MTLDDCVKFLLLLMPENIHWSLHDRKCWHMLFARLTALPAHPGRPRILDGLAVDGQRTYAWYPELDACLSAICMGGEVRWRGVYTQGAYYFSDGAIERWLERYGKIDVKERIFFETVCVPIVREEFPSLRA